MRIIQTFCAVFVAAGILRGQAPPPEITPAAQPDLQTLSAAVRNLRRSASVSDDVKTQADKLIAESTAPTAARRNLANAYVLLQGQSWDDNKEYAWSLALRPNEVVADPSLPFIAHLSQTYPAALRSANPLKVRLSILQENGKASKPLGEFDLTSRNLIEQPLGLDADLGGVNDGSWLLSAQVMDGSNEVATVTAPLQIVKGIELDTTTLDHRLARIPGHEGAKATIRYPYVLALTVNAGRRHLNAADFGLPFQPQPPYDFVKGIKVSNQTLKSLEAGADPVYRAKGDQERYYWFPEAREMMAYHVYAPMKWDGKSKLPMVLVLHGNTRDQDYYFDRDDHILSRMAEQHGYLVVCPMGYRPNAGWGSSSLNRRPAGAAAPDAARLRQGELSEKDALNVLDLVTKEYPIDPARIYLFGHSAGGGGTWYMGEKYADKWAAIAASAAPTRPDGFPFDRLKGMPIMVCHGDKDDEVPVTNSRNMVKAARASGLDPQYLEVPGATHLTIVGIVEPKVFDFFDQHPHKN